jgi:tetratricopeptide (TPR) repeat protein
MIATPLLRSARVTTLAMLLATAVCLSVRADTPPGGAGGGVEPPPTNPGQTDLDAAIEAKLSATNLDDFSKVLELCKKAVTKGLDPESKKFADELYTGTLVDRAGMLVDVIFGNDEPDPRWQQMRTFAMRDLGEIVDRSPKLGQARLMIARLESLPGGDAARARAEAKQALELLGDDRLQQAKAHVVLASVETDDDVRTRHFDQAVELAPRDADIRRARGLFMLVQDKFDTAREDLAVAIEEDPEDASLHEALGMAYAMEDKLDEARRAFDAAIKLEPRSPAPLLQRARLLATREKYDEALADIDRAIRLDERLVAPRLLKARILQQADRDAEAQAEVEAVLARDKDNAGALELRGLMAAEREDYPAAILDFRRLVRQNSDDPAVIGQLGMLYLAAKQPRKAIERFTRALEIDDEDFPSRRGRSDALISIGDHKGALADLERALEIKPDDTGVLNNLAWLLATSPDDDLRDGARAIDLAKKACELTEWKEAHIISTLAAGHAERKDFETAKKYSRQAVESSGETADVTEQLKKELASYDAGKPWRERQEAADAEPAEPATSTADGARPPVEAEPQPPRRPFDSD